MVFRQLSRRASNATTIMLAFLYITMKTLPTRSYWICSTPRTGGTLLCQLLLATNVAGRPEEFFFRPVEVIYREKWRIKSYTDYIQHALVQGTTPNGMFGAKVDTGDYLSHFEKQVRAIEEFSSPTVPFNSILTQIFPNLKFIWLTRRNKVRQAVSWWKAAQSKEWSRNVGVQSNKIQNLCYKFSAIDKFLNESVLRESAWQEHFLEWGVIPLTLVYEDYIQDFQGTIRQILEFLEINDVYTYREEFITLARQSNALSEEWCQRYLEDKQQVL